VLAGGLYYGVAGGQPVRPANLVGLAGGLALLLGLDVAERRRYGARTPAGPAVALLLARVAVFAGVAALDGSGLSRALFVLVPFTAYFAFGRAVSIGLAAGCVGLLLTGYALLVPGWYADPRYVSDVLMLSIGLVLAVSMAAVAVDEQRGRVSLERTLRELAESHTQLRACTARVAELSATTERNRLARDIHDSLGHHLTAISVQLEKAAAYRDRDRAVAEQADADARSSARRALEEVRRSVRALREETPPFQLSAALAELADQIDDDGFRVTVDVRGAERGHGTAALSALYRAAQEGLTNARRHGQATRASVTVTFDGSGARLVVADNGRGFPTNQTDPTDPTDPIAAPGHRGFGLLGMRERIQLLGGQVDIDGRPGTGAVITVTLPASTVDGSTPDGTPVDGSTLDGLTAGAGR
jgi:signal transduction histidine kinase